MSKFVLGDKDCLDAAARNLHDLLDVICDFQFKGGDQIDRRVDSLLWIARDMSQGIIDKLNAEASA
jgi:hypothetical protein